MFKSIKTGILAAILISTAVVAHAQKKLTEGTLVYAMEYKTEAPGAPKEMKVTFNGDISRMEIVQGPATIGIFADQKTGTGLISVSVPVAQIIKAAKLTKAEMEEANPNKTKLSDFTATGEKAMVAGYNAEKYTYKNDKGESYVMWATTELDLPLNVMTSDFRDFKGTVLKFSNATATVTVKSISDAKVGALSVTKAPEGFDEITYAEMKAMQGGGGE